MKQPYASILLDDMGREITPHGNIELPVHIVRQSISDYENRQFAWHCHFEPELTLIISGCLSYTAGQHSYLMTEGDVLFCNSNVFHKGAGVGTEDCTYLSVTFHPKAIYGEENSLINRKYVRPILEAGDLSSIFIPDTRGLPETGRSTGFPGETARASACPEDGCPEGGRPEGSRPEAAAAMKNLNRILLEGGEDHELEIILALTTIWHALYQHTKSRSFDYSKRTGYSKHIHDIIDYIQNHYSESITLDEIALHLGISKSECCRVFKQSMGMTIFDYLLEYRIQQSLPLIKSGMTITQAAGQTGFANPCYFGKVFKDRMHCTPSQYRKR